MEQQSILDSLKTQGPDAWLAYLRPFEEGEPVAGLSMLVIFPFAASRAKEQESLEWAEVAVRAAEVEAGHSSGVERENALFGAMQLRAWFISKRKSHPNHLVLDKETILHWATEGVTLSVPAAKEKAKSFWENVARAGKSLRQEDREQVRDDAHELRRMKRRLNVVRVLADCDELPIDSPLFEWLEIREQLP
jgi:hypothetical protein